MFKALISYNSCWDHQALRGTEIGQFATAEEALAAGRAEAEKEYDELVAKGKLSDLGFLSSYWAVGPDGSTHW